MLDAVIIVYVLNTALNFLFYKSKNTLFSLKNTELLIIKYFPQIKFWHSKYKEC